MLGGISVGSSIVRGALKYSLFDGMLCAAMVAMLDTFTIAGAIYLKVPLLAIGVLAGLPLLLSSLFVGVLALDHTNRSTTWLFFVGRGVGDRGRCHHRLAPVGTALGIAISS